MNLKQQDIKVVLKEIEEGFPVNEWKFENFEVWPLIRIRLWFDLSYKALSTNTQNSILYESKKKQILRVLFAPFKWFYHSLRNYNKTYFRIPNGDVFILGDGVSFAKINEKYFDKFSDSLTIFLQSQKIKAVRVDSTNTFYKPTLISSFYIQPILDIIIAKALIISKISKKEISLSNHQEIVEIVKKFDAEAILDKNLIFSRAIKIKILAEYFANLLKKKKFKAAMSVCYYSDIGLALNLACSKIGIPSYDIQHGVQGDNHGAYGSWTNVPLGGYHLLPNYFLCWSELEKKCIDSWSSKLQKHQTLVTGHLFANIWQSRTNDWSRKYSELFNNTITTTNPKILLTLGWDVSDKISIESTLSVIQKTQQQFLWLIRLHPSMLSEKGEIINMLKHHDILNYELELASNMPIYTILENVDLHVTHSSSSTIEATYFNVSSIVTSNYGWALLSDQVNEKYIHLGITDDEILSKIELIRNIKLENVVSGNSNTLSVDLQIGDVVKTFIK